MTRNWNWLKLCLVVVLGGGSILAQESDIVVTLDQMLKRGRELNSNTMKIAEKLPESAQVVDKIISELRKGDFQRDQAERTLRNFETMGEAVARIGGASNKLLEQEARTAILLVRIKKSLQRVIKEDVKELDRLKKQKQSFGDSRGVDVNTHPKTDPKYVKRLEQSLDNQIKWTAADNARAQAYLEGLERQAEGLKTSFRSILVAQLTLAVDARDLRYLLRRYRQRILQRGGPEIKPAAFRALMDRIGETMEEYEESAQKLRKELETFGNTLSEGNSLGGKLEKSEVSPTGEKGGQNEES